MRKFMVLAIPIVTLTLFILIMLSGDFLKRPLTGNDDIPKAIEGIIEDINNERWEDAGRKTEDLGNSWKRIVRRIQFSSERDEINFFSVNIARLRGAIMAKDKSHALIILKEAYEHWDGLGR